MAEERIAHTARVYTNETCNQNCAFCDRRAPRERPEFVARSAVEARIDAADAETLVLTGGEPTLRIHQRCQRLIESIEAYRYPDDQPGAQPAAHPVKDGNDHAVDALRYLLAVLESSSTVVPRVKRWSR